MGRGRVQLKRIENKINRQVTFSKRRNGLLKKAFELSVLCDAEVALIIFSTDGRLFEFCSNSSMLKTIERYQHHTCPESEALEVSENQNGATYQCYLKMRARYEILQQSERNLLGEGLSALGEGELEQLEAQVEKSLKHIRMAKTQSLLNQLCDLKRKEQMLLEANSDLKKKLQEVGPQYPVQQSWEDDIANRPEAGYMLFATDATARPSQSQEFFQLLRLSSHQQNGHQPIHMNDLFQ